MIPVIQNRNTKILLSNSQLQSGAIQFSYLSEPAVVGDAQIFLQDYIGFTDNQALLIEDFGSETAEIVTVNGTPSVNAGAVTDAVLVRSHPVGSKVYILDYDQIELSHATTTTGSKTVLTLNSGIVSVQPDTKIQVYNESEFSTGYYFARYKHSISGVFSGYTDALAYGGWNTNTVGYMIDRALRDLSETLSNKVTREDCYAWINAVLQLIQGKLKHWPEHYSYKVSLGHTQRGLNVVAMPTDAYDTETNKSILNFYIGAKLQYLAPQDFDRQKTGSIGTQVTTQAVAGQTTLEINNSYDFPDSGTVDVFVSNLKYSVAYTGITRSTTAGILTGVPATGTGAITVTIPVNSYVWQLENEGTPEWFTVKNSNIEFWPLVDGSSDNQNIFCDYSKVATSVDSDGDIIDIMRFDMVQAYLTWRIEAKAKNNGVLSPGMYVSRRFVPNGWYSEYETRLNDAIKTLPQNNIFKSRPSLNRIGNMRYPRRGLAPASNT